MSVGAGRLQLSPEVEAALRDGKGVVALESSVICQGLPPPHNLASALACEKAVRDEGAVPATVAMLDGRLRVGLEPSEIERLATERGMLKLAVRDLAFGIARRASGGTTVSATLAVCAEAGLPVFATGGIGGVHRGEALDISADLHALARYPAAVVCAGAKAILDLPRTLEMLETLSVPVVGLRTTEFPAFYARRSGLPLDQHVADEGELAQLCLAQRALGMTGAILAVQPCPEAVAIPTAEIDAAIESALVGAARIGVKGPAVTPFLLGAVARATGGRALTANLALLENNARAAARLAKAMLEH